MKVQQCGSRSRHRIHSGIGLPRLLLPRRLWLEQLNSAAASSNTNMHQGTPMVNLMTAIATATVMSITMPVRQPCPCMRNE